MRVCAKVLGLDGKLELIELDAASPEEAERRLRSEGLPVISVVSLGEGLRLRVSTKGFRLDVFNQQLHALLEAGQAMVDAIDILQHYDASPRDRRIYSGLLQAMQQGRSLSDAMSLQTGVFPPLYVAMIQASETTGTVRVAIRRYMSYQAQVSRIRSKLTAASVYPAILLLVGLIVIAFLLLYVVPRFSLAFDDVANHGRNVGGFVYLWGTWVRHHTAEAWGGLLILLLSFFGLIAHPATRARIQAKLTRLPGAGRRIRIFQLARIYRTLGLLLQSGLPVIRSLQMTQKAMGGLYFMPMAAVRKEVEEGMPLSVALRNQALTTEVSARLLVAGETSGNLDEMLERAADFHDEEIAGWIEMIGRIIEPVLMVGIGLVIGVVVMLLYMPIFELANSVE